MPVLDFERLRDGDAITPEEGELLYALVRSVKPTICVETGTHKSLSTHYIAEALKENGKGHVYTCDPHDWGVDTSDGNIRLSPLKEWMTYKNMRGDEFVPPGKIDFLFLDGAHEKHEVLSEFGHYLPYLAPDAIVVFHDCKDAPTPEHLLTADVNGAIRFLEIKTVKIPTHNHMRIYYNGYDSTD